MKKIKSRGKKVKNYLLQMLNQFIPVILGVFLGILASNWNTDRVQEAEQEEFVRNIYLELQSNKSKMEESLSYRKSIFSSAKKVRKELDPKILEAGFWSVGHWKHLPGWEGVKVPTLENSVYQSGVMTNALSGLDFKIINSIARSYNYQDEYKQWAERKIIEKLDNMPSDITTFEALSMIEPWYDIISLEQNLIRQYEQTLEILKNQDKE